MIKPARSSASLQGASSGNSSWARNQAGPGRGARAVKCERAPLLATSCKLRVGRRTTTTTTTTRASKSTSERDNGRNCALHSSVKMMVMNRKRAWPRAWPLGSLAKLRGGAASQLAGAALAALLVLVALELRPLEAAPTAAASGSAATSEQQQQQPEQQQEQRQQTGEARAALEAELDALLRQHDAQSADSSKLLSEAIISRWMLGNLSDATGASAGNANELVGAASDLDGGPAELAGLLPSAAGELDQAPQTQDERPAAAAAGTELSGPEVMRLRKMLAYLHNYELAQAASGLNNGQAFSQFPVLPASQAATIKRASMKMGGYLRGQQQQHGGAQRQLASYSRNNFDFGLGKRPDASVAGNILRFGDSPPGLAVSSQFGKRPSALRYDFGLGKRVASPAYPRYDFGLGKRAPNRIRYDFGLGRR